MSSTVAWASHWLPFRPTDNVYWRFDYSMLPSVDPGKFVHYKTADDVRANPPPIGPNPLFCEWCFDLPGEFMCDRRFDIHWSVDKHGCVAIPGQVTVAPSLAVFLARMSLENSIWWSIVDNGLDELARDRAADPQHIWDMIQPALSEEQRAYLRPYYERSKNWYRISARVTL